MKILSKLTTLILVVALAISFSSCKDNCYSCTGSLDGDIEYCDVETGSKTATKGLITIYEADGVGTCTKK